MIQIHWLPLTLDQRYMDDLLRMTEEYSVSAVHLSHLLVHNVDDVLGDSPRLEQVKLVLDKIRKKHLDVWCWTHEILRPPAQCIRDGILQLDHSDLLPYIEKKHDYFFQKLLPGLRGLILTFAETQYEVYKGHKVKSSIDGQPDAPALRSKYLVDALQKVCSKNGVRLTIRDFVYRMKEIDAMLRAISKIDDQVAVMSKWCPHDWQPFYPDNPVIGRVGKKEQWVEFDLGHEYEMQTQLPYAEPGELFTRIHHAQGMGINTFCLRLDRYDADRKASAIYQPWGQLELQVFSKVATRPAITLDQIISEWEKNQFPGAWEIVRLSTAVIKRMLFPQKLWLANHSNLPTFQYAKDHLKDGNADRLPVWTGKAEDLHATEMCDRPTPDFYQKLLKDDEENFQDVMKIRQVSEVIQCPSPELANYWRKGIRLLETWADLYRLYKKAYFGIRMAQNISGSISRQTMSSMVDELEKACEKFKNDFPDHHLTKKPAGESHPKVVASLREQLNTM